MSSGKFNQPYPTNQSVYPYNHVTQSRSGHVFEVDDTLGNERIHEKHKSGTYRMVNADGSLSTVVVANRHTTVCGEDYVTISGNANITINGNANLTINGSYNVEVNGNMNQTVKGEYRLKVGASYKNEVLGDKAENITGKKDVIIGNGLNNTIRGGGITSMVVGDVSDSVAGGYTAIYTGSSDTTALTGISLTSAAATTLGGMSVALDSASTLNITSLGMTTMMSSLTNITTSLVNVLGGAILAAGDIRAGAGVTGLLTHVHIGDGTGYPPAPTQIGLG